MREGAVEKGICGSVEKEVCGSVERGWERGRGVDGENEGEREWWRRKSVGRWREGGERVGEVWRSKSVDQWRGGESVGEREERRRKSVGRWRGGESVAEREEWRRKSVGRWWSGRDRSAVGEGGMEKTRCGSMVDWWRWSALGKGVLE